MSDLTDKQERFVQGLIKGLSQREAYRIAYPKSVNWKDETVDVNASKLFSNTKVLLRYNELHDKLMAQAEKETIMSATEILEELSIIGRSKIDDFLEVKSTEMIVGTDEEGEPIKQNVKFVEVFETKNIDPNKIKAISEIKQTRDGISLKLSDKLKALETLGRHWGLFSDKIELSGSMNISQKVANMSEEEKQKRKEELKAKLGD